jgi:hypothetical protein
MTSEIRQVRLRLLLVLASVLAIASAGARADAPVSTPEPYRAFEKLIGDWDTGPASGRPAFVQRFSWGPNRSYIWSRTSLFRPDGSEHLHFEGLMVWNAATRGLDFLFVVEPASLAQERGTMQVSSDGGIVRDVVLTGSDGKEGRFRHTIRLNGADTGTTSLMRQTSTGWEPSFPGADNLHMTRR